MSNLIEFAKQELNILTKGCKDSESIKTQLAVNEDILNIIQTFLEQGHSGFSAQYTINILTKLLDYKPLTPLTGEDDEWTELDYGGGIAFQNKRCPSVFKDYEGRAYNAEGKVFSDDNGHTWYTSKGSSVYIEFPYVVPKSPEYIIIDNKEERQEMQNKLLSLIEALGGKIPQDVNEDTPLQELLNEDKYEVLEKAIIDTFNIKKLLFSVKDDVYVWSLVNLVMNSDKTEE